LSHCTQGLATLRNCQIVVKIHDGGKEIGSVEGFLLHKWRELSMTGNCLEFNFHWRKL